MITLDCSEHIDDEVAHLADSRLRGAMASFRVTCEDSCRADRERRYELSDGAC